jgi:hypothetical protein
MKELTLPLCQGQERVGPDRRVHLSTSKIGHPHARCDPDLDATSLELRSKYVRIKKEDIGDVPPLKVDLAAATARPTKDQ